MADPLLRLMAAGARPVARTRPLLATGAQIRAETAAGPKPGPAPSLFDQVSGMVTGLPGGLIGMGTEAVKSAAGFPRLALDVGGNVVHGRAPGEGFSTDFGSNFGEYFPLLEQFRESGMRTGYRVTHPGDYLKASREGNLVGAIAEDAANLSIAAAPVAKLAGAAAGRTAVAAGADAAAEQVGARAGAEVTAKAGAEHGAIALGPPGAKVGADAAAEAGAKAGAEGAAEATGRFQPRFLTKQRFPMPSTLTAEQVARPGLLRFAQGIEAAARPAEEVAGAPARVWSAPVKLATGVELPKLFGTTGAGAPRRFGVKPVLDAAKVTEKVMGMPRVAAAAEKFGNWQEERGMKRTFRQEQLLPGSADVHLQATELQRDFGPALKALNNDPTLMHAALLLRTGMHGTLGVVPALEQRLDEMVADGRIPAEARQTVRDRVLAETFGISQAPTPEVIQTVNDYVNGTMDPQTRARIDVAHDFLSRPIDRLQEQKIERGQLNEEQTGQVPMPYAVEAQTAPTRERIQELHDELHGYDRPNGEHVPGLIEQAQAAQAAIPRPDLGQLAGQRAQAAARKAGATEAEVELLGRQATQRYAEAEQAAQRADRARQGTLAGARAEMEQLQRERYGYTEYHPEWTRSQLEAGRAERAQGPSAVGYTVPDAEYQLAERLARLEGEGRTRGVEQQAPRARAAQEQAAGAAERRTAAEGRIFTGAAEPVYAPENALPFGQFGQADLAAVAQMSDAEAARYVRDVRGRVRDQMRERRYEVENRVAQAGGAGLPIQIPDRTSGMWDAYQEIQQALGRSGGGKSGFRNPRFAVGTGGVKGGTESLFAKGRGTPLDVVLDNYDLEQLIGDIGLVQEWKAAEGSVIKHGLEGRVGEEYTHDPVESAALGFGETPAAIAAIREAHTNYVMPEARLGPSPWTMDREAYRNELTGVSEAIAVAGDPAGWTPEQVRADERMLELYPESLGDMAGLTDDQMYDRVRQGAQVAGRQDIAAEVSPVLAAGEAGRGAVRESQAIAEEAVKQDQDLREFAAANGREPPSTINLARTHLLDNEKRIYDSIVAGEKEGVATERLGEARQRLTAGTRLESEAAGQHVGEAVGAGKVLTKQAAAAEQRLGTVEPRIEPAVARAQAEQEAAAQKAVNFGRRVGKRERDVQNMQRIIRTKAGKLSWLEDEYLPAMQARLAEGPRSVAPGKYAQQALAGERFQAAATRMGEQLAEQTGDPSMATAFADIAADVPTTMAQMHERGIYPEYLPGAVDRPTKGSPTMAGGQEQMPWFRAAPSAHQKRYGHVPAEIRTVERSLINDIRVMVEQDSARKIDREVAKGGRDVIDEAVRRGELDQETADFLVSEHRAPEDFAKRMESYGYTAWDPEKPRGPSDRQAGPDSRYVPTPIFKEFQRWWKPANTNGAIRVYDQITRGFKHGVLAMSPTWHVNNVLGNAFMAVVFGGESPAAIYRATRDVLANMRVEGRNLRESLPAAAPAGGGRLSRSGRAVVNRVGPLRRVQEWGRDVAAAPPTGPPRLYGAGGAAEVSRQLAEMKEPRTWFGRGLQQSYRVNEMVDNIGRSALFELKRKRGYDPEQSVGLALQAMGDFHNMTHFEREYIRRIVPFYAWMRHVTQASLKLAVEHPWRTAWMLHLSDQFSPNAQNTGIPEYLRGGLGVGGGWFVPFGGANPLAGNAGSIFTSPKQWPTEIMRSLNPNIKLLASLGGLNLSQGRVVTRPPGTGPLNQYGQPMWGPPALNELAYMTLRQVPQGRLLTDVAYNPGANELLPRPVLRYDTGQVIKRQGRTIPQTGGRIGGVFRNLNVPFFPSYVDEAQTRARIVKGQRAAAKARATYNA